jgi:signal transduction histidine kinase
VRRRASFGCRRRRATGCPAQAQELSALATGGRWPCGRPRSREEARTLAEELAEANRRLLATQDALLRTRALTTVGEMAAGAAHEMNNPLAVISGRSQLLARTIPDEKQRAMAKLVHEQADRLSDIITEMMAFAKPQPPVPAACDVGSLISTALTRAKARTEPADRNIEVTIGVVPRVLADAEQVSAAIAEVIDNALQATDPRAGRLASGRATTRGRAGGGDGDGRRVRDGRATLTRAFDPFYSSSRPAAAAGSG